MMTVVVMDGQANGRRTTRDAQGPRVQVEVAFSQFPPDLVDADQS